MRKTISLVLPVLVPSWRFFSAVQPSPRVQFALLKAHDDTPDHWQEFRPRPKAISLLQMAGRLLWNPQRNEALFLVSCAERIQANPTPHSIEEIRRRILLGVEKMPTDAAEKWMQFRLVFVQRGDLGLSQEVVFLSETYPTLGGAER